MIIVLLLMSLRMQKRLSPTGFNYRHLVFKYKTCSITELKLAIHASSRNNEVDVTNVQCLKVKDLVGMREGYMFVYYLFLYAYLWILYSNIRIKMIIIIVGDA